MRMYTNVARRGNNILLRGYDNGGQVLDKIRFMPTLFFESPKYDTDWSGIHGENLIPRVFDTMRDATDTFKTHKEIANSKLHGMTNYVSQFIHEQFPGDIEFQMSHIDVGNVDIEVESDEGFPEPDEAKYPINAICYNSSKSGTYHVWGLGDYDPLKSNVIKPDDPNLRIQYRKCKNEESLILQFLKFWENNYPDILTGWNVQLFDVPYIVNRILRILGKESAKRLSPWGYIDYRERRIMDRTFDTYTLVGISVIDYLDIFKKFDFVHGTPESYALDHIAHIVLGERKLSYAEHGSLHSLSRNDHQLFIDYNVKDVMLVGRHGLEGKLRLIEQVITMAYMAGVNYSDTLGTVGIWDTIIYRFLADMNVAVPPEQFKTKEPYPGGYVKDPHVGMHHWVTSFDLNSLYPWLIVQYNMSPETIVDDSVSPNGVEYFLDNAAPATPYAVAVNGSMYSKEKQGVLPQIIIDYYAQRKAIKRKMLDKQNEREHIKGTATQDELDNHQREIDKLNNGQMAVKILMNSLYGALGNQYFRYYDTRMAEGITLSGQLAIRWAERAINREMNSVMKSDNEDYVIAMDTDSLYVNMAPLVEAVKPTDPVSFIDKACEARFVPVLTQSYEELYHHMHAYESRMVMAREAIADTGVWTAKKRYILNVHNNEGVQYAKPKLKMMGIEAVKSSTPQIVRDKFKQAFAIIMEGDEAKLQKFVADFDKEFSTLPAHEVSFPRGISQITKWQDPHTQYKKGCPIHVRGAIVYNAMIKKYGIDDSHEAIQNGTKVKFCYLKVPNHTMGNVISFVGYLPTELELDNALDYKLQFEKSFKAPLRIVTDAIGWNVEKINTLEALFGQQL